MAEFLIGIVTETVLNKVISLASQQIGSLLGVKKDLEDLAEKLKMIQALLSDAESKSTTKKTIEVWLKKLEDAATDADDLLDEVAYEVQHKKMQKGKKSKVSSIFSSSNPLVLSSNMVSKIKEIKLQMDELFDSGKNFGLNAVAIMNSHNDPRQVRLTTDPFVDETEIVGRGDDVSELLSQLICSNDEKNLSVIGIVGMGGQGKTTIAQLLMKNVEENKHFEKTIWTCVSEDFNVDRILKDMLQSLTKKASKLTNREAIVEMLSKELQGKRFLLVLDDVWNEEWQLWEYMSNSLKKIGGSKGSKIIVTTRNDKVVELMNGYLHRLEKLSEKESQELFERKAFGNGRVAKTSQLVEIGKRIVAKCGGLPLAVKAIGSLMSSRRDEREWGKIEEISSIWSTLDVVHSALKLSFDHLPSLYLKQCFAYCSIFPKDSVIGKKDLIQQWMAHGLLNPSRESGWEMEEVGNNYIEILQQRSFLQEPKFDMYNNVVSYKMHDLVHDFAFDTSKGRCLAMEVGEISDDIKTVHLSIVLDRRVNLNVFGRKFSRLRTLYIDSVGVDFSVLCKCKRLRVLTVMDYEIKKLPVPIVKLKHLRYLDVSDTEIEALPKFISKLYNLQTLKLPLMLEEFCRRVNLRLRHLHFKDTYLHNHHLSGIGQLTSLRTLDYFQVSRDKRCQIEELCKLNHLEGSLRIKGLENVVNEEDARKANLSEKRNIESLELEWSTDREGSIDNEGVLVGLQPHWCLKALEINGFMGTSLPSWIPELRNLKRLKLYGLKNCEQIPALGHLKFLEVLRIRDMNSVKCVGNDFYGWSVDSSQTSADVFPSLKELKIDGMSSLKEWSEMVQPSFVSSSSAKLFPCPKKFEIHACPCLIRLPEDLLSASTSLESLSISFCDKMVSIPDLSSLHSLKELIITFCPFFNGLPRGIEACKSLCRFIRHP